MKIIKILALHSTQKQIKKIIIFHTRIKKIIKNPKHQCDNYKNYENPSIPQ